MDNMSARYTRRTARMSSRPWHFTRAMHGCVCGISDVRSLAFGFRDKRPGGRGQLRINYITN